MEEINGKVKVSGEYFMKMAKADYRDYRQALWREIYQNSIDAGSRNITVTWNEEERSITILDDGCGMDLETLTEKLLALGGSKKAEGATGAFGKAKELELFAHKEYLLHTHQYMLMGSGDNYTINETDDYLEGCSITIYVNDDEDFGYITGFSIGVAKKIETSCIINVDGKVVECAHPKGELRKSLDVGDIYVNDDLPASNYAKFRVNGIWMFDQYVGSDIPHITVELSANSVECLNSNRDGLKGSHLDDANKFFQKLASDRKSALFPDKVEIKLHAKGTDGNQIQLSDEDMEFLEKRYMGRPQKELAAGIAEFMEVNGGLDKAITKLRMEDDPGDYDRDYGRLKYFGFKWNTIHKFQKGQEKEAKSFLDGSAQNAKRANTLLTMWGETLKQIMLDTGMYEPFTIGFNWDSDMQAQIQKDADGVCFYINPSILEKYALTKKALLARKLKQFGCHEIAHFQREYHDEYFVGTMEDYQEKTWKSDRIYARIAKIK